MNDATCKGQIGSVLMVDDDEFSCDIMCAMLGDLGVTEVHCAGSGRAGLRTLARLASAPDVLICDLFMPYMDGIEFMAELARQRYPGRVILISGGNAEMLAVAKELALAGGIQLLGCLSKPLSRQMLLSVLAKNIG